MSYVLNYGNTPQATFSWSPNANFSYVIVSWTGNTTATSTTNTSGSVYLPINSYTTNDLSLNTKYTFTMTPYNSGGGAGNSNTFTCDTTPSIRYFNAVNSTYSSIQLYWLGVYNTVAITRAIGTLNAKTIETSISDTTYKDTDISGNTTYSYYVTPTYSGITYGKTSTVSLTTAVQPPSGVSIIYYDSSAIKVSFNTPKNSYSTSYVYTVTATDNTGNVIDSSGTTNTILIQNLSGETFYTCNAYVKLDSNTSLIAYSSTTSSVTTMPGIAAISNVLNGVIYGGTSKTTNNYTSLLENYTIYCDFNSTSASGNTLYNYGTGSYDINAYKPTNISTTATNLISTSVCKYGSGSFYSGSSDYYVKLPSITTNGSSLSILFWVYFSSSAATNDTLRCYDFGNGADNYNILGRASISSSSIIQFQYLINNTGTTGWTYTITNTTSYTLGTWMHFAVVHSGTTVYMYANGSLIGTSTNITFPNTLTRTSNMIGRSNWAEDTSTTVYLDEFYFFNSALSASQISKYYSNSSIDDYVIYCDFNTTSTSGNTLYNYSSKSYDIITYINSSTTTSSSNVISTSIFKYGSGSYYSSSTLYFVKLPSITTNGSSLSVLFWVYFSSSATSSDKLFCFDIGNGTNGYNILGRTYFSGNTTSLKYEYLINTGGTDWAYSVSNTTSYTLGTWTHWALVHSGTTVYMYANGSLIGTSTNITFPNTLTRTSNMIGRTNWGEDTSSTAYLDEFYFFNSALTQSQIQMLM